MIETTGASTPTIHQSRNPELWRAAQRIEGAFLSEMLKSAGLGTTRESFGGGAGEEQFSSFLRDAQVQGMVETGGIGLAESIYKSLARAENA